MDYLESVWLNYWNFLDFSQIIALMRRAKAVFRFGLRSWADLVFGTSGYLQIFTSRCLEGLAEIPTSTLVRGLVIVWRLVSSRDRRNDIGVTTSGLLSQQPRLMCKLVTCLALLNTLYYSIRFTISSPSSPYDRLFMLAMSIPSLFHSLLTGLE